VLLCRDGVIDVAHLPAPLGEPPANRREAGAATTTEGESQGAKSNALRTEMMAIERQRIIDALAKCNGNQTHAAELLGMPRRTLIARMRAFDLPKRNRQRTEE